MKRVLFFVVGALLMNSISQAATSFSSSEMLDILADKQGNPLLILKQSPPPANIEKIRLVFLGKDGNMHPTKEYIYPAYKGDKTITFRLPKKPRKPFNIRVFYGTGGSALLWNQ